MIALRNSLAAFCLGVVSVTAGPALAGGGMGDCSAFTRYMQDICDKQKRGEYPRDHNACRSDDAGAPAPAVRR